MIKKIALYGKAGAGKDYLASQLIHYFEKYTSHKAHRFAFADELKTIIKDVLGLSDEDAKKFMHDEDSKNNTYIDLEDLRVIYIGNYNLPKDKSDNPVFFSGDRIGYDEDITVCLWTAKSLAYHVGMNFNYNIGVSEFIDHSTDHMNLISYREFIVYLGTYVMQRMLCRLIFVNKIFNSREYDEAIFNDDFIIITDVRFESEYVKCKDEEFFVVEVVNDSADYGIDNIAESHYKTFKPDYVFHNSYDKVTFDERFVKLLSAIMNKEIKKLDLSEILNEIV